MLSLVVLTVWFLQLGCGAADQRAASPTPRTAELLEEAEAAEKERRYDRARALYEQAKREAPDRRSRAAAARAYGRAQIFWGEYGQGTAELEESVHLDPGDAGTWHDLGIVRHQQGDMAGAEQALRRALSLRPDDGRPRIALAALLWKTQRYREALREYQALEDVDLPEGVRDKVEWAIETLRRKLDGQGGTGMPNN